MRAISIVKWIIQFALMTVIGLAGIGGTGRWALEPVRVGGPLYAKIKLGNDLVADILPPPERAVATACAGEAGCGFCRVAHEVKALSKKTSEAVAVAKGDISEQELFDFSYRPVAQSPAIRNGIHRTLRRILPDMQKPMLDLDPRVIFCAAVDTNALLPTHNGKFSLAPRPDDPV